MTATISRVESSFVIGVDVGGTNVRSAAYAKDGTAVSQKFSQPSSAQDGVARAVTAISDCIQQAIDSSPKVPLAVGIAMPGHIDGENGIVRWAPNFGEDIEGIFRYWENIQLAELLSETIQMPIFIGNDANLAALAEYRYGTGRNSANCLVMLTVGTGIGGGVILSQKAVTGDARGPLMLVGGNQGGAELGHVSLLHGGLDCNAGSYGALEAYCQRDSIVLRALHRLKRGRKSIISDMVAGDLSNVTPRTLSVAADEGDDLAIEIWTEIGTMLGVAIGSYINIFAPDIVAVGGQIAKAGDWLLEPARKTARNVAIPSLFADSQIVMAEYIEEAGMLGGAALAFEQFERVKM
jgi:glucokinase